MIPKSKIGGINGRAGRSGRVASSSHHTFQALNPSILFLLSVASLSSHEILTEARVTVSHVVLPISHAPNYTSTVKYEIYTRDMAVRAQAPTFFLLNGFNVASSYYSNVVTQLADAGFVVATASETRPVPFPIPGLPLPGCSSNYTIITGIYLNLLYLSNSINPGVRIFHRSSFANGVILLGHSYGGAAAVAIIAGLCGTAANKTVDPLWLPTCAGYLPMADNEGKDLVKGAVVHEGYVSVPITLPRSTSISYTAGQYNNATYNAHLSTSGGFNSFTRIDHANHYAINNFIRGVNGSQVALCALKAKSDPLDYQATAMEVEGFNKVIVQVAIATANRYKKRPEPGTGNTSIEPKISPHVS